MVAPVVPSIFEPVVPGVNEPVVPFVDTLAVSVDPVVVVTLKSDESVVVTVELVFPSVTEPVVTIA